MPRQRRTRVENDPPEPDDPQDAPAIQHDAGALIAKERCGPLREKYPMTEGQANFATFSQSIIDAEQEPK